MPGGADESIKASIDSNTKQQGPISGGAVALRSDEVHRAQFFFL
jgi:hypothetical protein